MGWIYPCYCRQAHIVLQLVKNEVEHLLDNVSCTSTDLYKHYENSNKKVSRDFPYASQNSGVRKKCIQ